MVKRSYVVTMALLASGLLSGCAYYRVTDPATNKVYYTNNWNAGRYAYSGAARFIDASTGRDVTLPSTEVEQISEAEWRKQAGRR